MKKLIAATLVIGASLLGLPGTANAAPVTLSRAALQQASTTGYITLVAQSVNDWATVIGRPGATWYVASSDEPTGACRVTGGTTNAWYCLRDKVIQVGDKIVAMERQNHVLAPAVAMAHEWGHQLQDASGAWDGVFSEDQSDCVGGAWLGWANQRYSLGVSLLDLPGLATFVSNIARPAGVSRKESPHGSFGERGVALANGFFHGIGACNAYDPAHPL